MIRLCALFSLCVVGLRAIEVRKLSVDDLLLLEEIAEVAVSPDGDWFAYVLRRARSGSASRPEKFRFGSERGDVWVSRIDGSRLQNLTRGALDGSGSWAPAWSSDSRRLTFLSTKGAGVGIWAWDRQSGDLNRLLSGVTGSCPGSFSSGQLLCATLPAEPYGPGTSLESQAGETAIRQWRKSWEGQSPAVSVLESGGHVEAPEGPQGRLELLSGRVETLIAKGRFRDVRLDPEKQHFSALRLIETQGTPVERALAMSSEERWELVLGDVSGKHNISGLDRLSVRAGTARWAPQGSELAFVAFPRGQSPQLARVYRLSMQSRALTAVSDERVKPLRVLWSLDGVLLFSGRGGKTTSSSAVERIEWWAVPEEGEARMITAESRDVPVWLLGNTRQGLFGVAGGELLRFGTTGGPAERLTTDFEPRINHVLWPPRDASADGVLPDFVLVTGPQEGREFFRFRGSSGTIERLDKPVPEATLAGFSFQTGTAVFTAATNQGSFLWLSQGDRQTSIVETNQHLKEIAEPRLVQIEYKSLRGRPLKGWVVLPFAYEEGTSYPLIAFVYPGDVQGDEPPLHARLNYGRAHHNVLPLAAHGYAVLFPSMPLGPEGVAANPYFDLPDGVLPALDKVIEMGVADPNRLGVIGLSFGGFATTGLIAQTNRFKAAVSLAGFVDLTSLYGSFDARFRYGDDAHERGFLMSLFERGSLRMGGPPWKDPERYRRNSPLTYVEKIETPLMIIQGDLDLVPIQQGEELFSALFRLGKQARFVRYWGEGHAIQNPANLRDMWDRIFSWYDRFLK